MAKRRLEAVSFADLCLQLLQRRQRAVMGDLPLTLHAFVAPPDAVPAAEDIHPMLRLAPASILLS